MITKLMKGVMVMWCLCLAVISVGCGGGGGSDQPGVTGGNFACQVDGSAFPVASAWFASRGSERVIYATTGDEVRSIWIQFDPPASVPATIPLGNPSRNWGLYTADWRTPGNQYFTTSPPSGTLTITALTDTQCAGTFSFKAQRPGGGEVTLTNGSFDLPSGPLPE